MHEPTLHDANYAYIDSHGQRYLPLAQAEHVRTSLAQWPTLAFESTSAKASALKRIGTAAKKFNIASALDDKDSPLQLLFQRQLHSMVNLAAEDVIRDATGLPTEIEIMKVGTWNYAFNDPVTIDENDLHQFVANFQAGIRKGIAFDCDHDMAASTGWVQSLRVGSDAQGIATLFATVEWTPMGAELLNNKIYKFFSPEWYETYEDPETGQLYENVLTGGALTNRPLMKSLAALTASESSLTLADTNSTLYVETKRKANAMDLTVLRQKETPTAEEMDFLKSHAADLTSQELARFQINLPELTEEETKTTVTDGDETEPEGAPHMSKETLKADELRVSKEEYDALMKKADEGAVAFKELQALKAKEKVSGWIASEMNKEGKFTPAIHDDLATFYNSLTSKQATEFDALVDKMPSANLFSEVTTETDEEPETSEEATTDIAKLASEKMDQAKSQGRNLTYSAAVKEVMNEKKDLRGKLPPVEGHRATYRK